MTPFTEHSLAHSRALDRCGVREPSCVSLDLVAVATRYESDIVGRAGLYDEEWRGVLGRCWKLCDELVAGVYHGIA